MNGRKDIAENVLYRNNSNYIKFIWVNSFIPFFLFFVFLSVVVLSLTSFSFISTIPFLWNLYLLYYFHNGETINERLRFFSLVYGFFINRLIFYLYTTDSYGWCPLWTLGFHKIVVFHICHNHTSVYQYLSDSQMGEIVDFRLTVHLR